MPHEALNGNLIVRIKTDPQVSKGGVYVAQGALNPGEPGKVLLPYGEIRFVPSGADPLYGWKPGQHIYFHCRQGFLVVLIAGEEYVAVPEATVVMRIDIVPDTMPADVR